MDREIKFRGKRLKDKEWVCGDLMSNICGTRIVRYKEADNGAKKRADWEYIDIAPDTVGQFTGLTDSAGKEIYEGDIILTRYNNRIRVKYGYKEHIVRHNGVEDSYAAYGWIAENIQNGITDFLDNEILQGKVIGNVYDNPELINRESI